MEIKEKELLFLCLFFFSSKKKEKNIDRSKEFLFFVYLKMFRLSFVGLRCFSQYYSKKKTVVPTRLDVTKGNEHLRVNLFDDENNQSLGQMSLIDAQKLAKFRQLILVLFDESRDPPDVRLMNGKQLAKIRDETRTTKKRDKIDEFVVKIRSQIEEKDLTMKLAQAKAAHEKGSTIRLTLDFGRTIDEKDAERLAERVDEQRKFLERLKIPLEQFPKVHTNSKSSRAIILIVPSKNLSKD